MKISCEEETVKMRYNRPCAIFIPKYKYVIHDLDDSNIRCFKVDFQFRKIIVMFQFCREKV